jgi:HEAT repeat protein
MKRFWMIGTLGILGIVALGCSRNEAVSASTSTPGGDATSESSGSVPLVLVPAGAETLASGLAGDPEIVRLVTAFQEQGSDWESILEQLESGFELREVMPYLQQLLRTTDSEKAEWILDWISGRTSADILPALESCLGNPDEAVRLAAVNAASHVTSSSLAGFMEKAFRDQSERVRLTFFTDYEHQSEATLLRVWEKALVSPHHDVRDAGIGELELQSNHRSVEVLFSALDSPYPETRQEAQEALDFMLDRTFSNATEARQWWEQNRKRYSADLVLEVADP